MRGSAAEMPRRSQPVCLAAPVLSALVLAGTDATCSDDGLRSAALHVNGSVRNTSCAECHKIFPDVTTAGPPYQSSEHSAMIKSAARLEPVNANRLGDAAIRRFRYR